MKYWITIQFQIPCHKNKWTDNSALGVKFTNNHLKKAPLHQFNWTRVRSIIFKYVQDYTSSGRENKQGEKTVHILFSYLYSSYFSLAEAESKHLVVMY